MNSGADVMNESGLREFCRTSAAADGVFGFVNADRAACARERDCGGETVWAGADNDGVENFVRRHLCAELL